MDSRLLAQARSVKGFMPDDEGLALHRIGVVAGQSGLGPLLEIGTYCGKSAVYLGAAAQTSSSVLISVDHHRGSEENQAGWEHHDPTLVDPASGRMDTLPLARRAIDEAGLAAHVVLIVGESTQVAALWSTPLALLFIDGGHGSTVAWADYRAWTPKVAPGGLLAIHDVFPDPRDGGRPPYELYCDAIESGDWSEDERGCGSLKILRRAAGATTGA
ncbi:MAG TPA: class I SAM-dependent methyltransferase [Acidimicrobiales bacterium]|nr:class I SAM-dependent methyltransferase [Acidimicrobiales bacterium]